jgi:hypothetical protein
MDNLILVSDWERAAADDFYLSKDWKKTHGIEKARSLQKENKLYVAYLVDAVSYAIYTQMDADRVFINDDGNVILWCESAVISNSLDWRIKYEG